MLQGLLATMACPPLAGISFAFGQSNLAGRVIVVVLFGGSIVVWSLMLNKFLELHAAKKRSEQFLHVYRRQANPLSLYLHGRQPRNHPLGVVYAGICEAVGSTPEAEGPGLDDAVLQSARSTASRLMADQTLVLEDGMGFLATASTIAPFLGLLGTVWGVMEAFQGMGESALLSAVAPGISGALMTTVVGLLVALPSVIGYNTLSGKIRRMTVTMDNFAQECLSQVQLLLPEQG